MGSQKSTNEGIQWQPMVLLVAYVVGLNFAITQWVAYRLHYHEALGRAVFDLAYQPFAWVSWLRWREHAELTFAVATLCAGVGTIIGIFVLKYWYGKKNRSAKQHAGLHGTAHWATKPEIEQAGLLQPSGRPGAGVYVGAWDDNGAIRYLRHDGPEHVACIAPTRSGKGVGLVIPTCLSWPHSIIVNDRKGELWNLTAGWRKKEANNITLRFNPSSPNLEDCVAFNPLEEVRLGTPSEVADTQNITSIIVDPDGKGLENHWQKTAFAFLTGAFLHEMYKAKERGGAATLSDVLYAITDPERDASEYYDEMMNNRHDSENTYEKGGAHPVVAAEGRTMANKPSEERGSVLSTAISYLSLFRDPIVQHHTRRSDFQIMDLMNADRPVSLYIINRDEDSDRMKPLMRLLLNQILRVLLRPEIQFNDGRQVAPHRHRLLLMLDEFPAYGRLEVFREQLAYIAGYGIKAYLIMQDTAQLWSAYGRDETITSNCHIRAAFAPNRPETAEWLSKLTGTTTELKWSITESGKRFGGFAEQFSKTSQEVSRPLMTPDEIMRLKGPEKIQIGDKSEITAPGEMLVFAAGSAPIKGIQPLFFKDPTFLARSKIPPPKTDTIRGVRFHPDITPTATANLVGDLWAST